MDPAGRGALVTRCVLLSGRAGIAPPGSLAGMPNLAGPTTGVRDSFLEAMRGLRAEGWLPDFPVEQAAADFGAYVGRVRHETQAWGVPISTLWYVDGDTYLGTVLIRHRLTPELARHGGHIGYHVAPGYRRQGHATSMLAAGLALLPGQPRPHARADHLRRDQHRLAPGHRGQRRAAGEHP